MKNTDTRVQYTKARFHNAMTELLERMPCGAVSVKELCDCAGLNRGTFYLHYADPMDVLREMEWEFAERTEAFIGNREPWLPERFISMLKELRTEQRLCSAVIGHNGDPNFLREISDKAYESVHDMLTANLSCSEPEMRARFAYVFSGCTGVVSAWLEGNGLSDEETATLLSDLCGSIMHS